MTLANALSGDNFEKLLIPKFYNSNVLTIVSFKHKEINMFGKTNFIFIFFFENLQLAFFFTVTKIVFDGKKVFFFYILTAVWVNL